jgi:hypothetical protein
VYEVPCQVHSDPADQVVSVTLLVHHVMSVKAKTRVVVHRAQLSFAGY